MRLKLLAVLLFVFVACVTVFAKMGWKRHRLAKRRKDQGLCSVSPHPAGTMLAIGLLNVDCWDHNSRADVEAAIVSRNIDIFSLTETHFRVEHKEKIEMPGFVLYESRREDAIVDRRGGGLACLVKDIPGLMSRQLQIPIRKPALGYVSSERLWVAVETEYGKTAVATVYCSCQTTEDRWLTFNQGIFEVLGEEVAYLRGQGFRVALSGDFNSWVGNVPLQGGILGNNVRTNANGKAFLEFLAVNQLTHVNGASRETAQGTHRLCTGVWTRHAWDDRTPPSVLDYIVLSNEHMHSVVDMEVDEGGVCGGASDHSMVFARLLDRFQPRPRPKVARRMGWDVRDETIWSSFKEIVASRVQGLANMGKGVERLSRGLTEALFIGLEKGIGRRLERKKEARVFPGKIVALQKERKSLEKRWKSEKSRFAASSSQVPPDSLVLARCRLKEKTDQLEIAVATFRRKRRGPLLSLGKASTRKGRVQFWSFVNRKVKKSTDIGSLQNKRTGIVKHEPEEISEEIHEYLKEIFSGRDDPEVQEPEEVQTAPEPEIRDHEYGPTTRGPHLPASGHSRHPGDDPGGFLDREIQVQEVQEVIKGLANSKAPGHDEIVNEALKNAPLQFLVMLTLLYNRVKEQGRVPEAWCRGRLVLVHKKG